MSVDTRNKRAACINLDRFSRVYPNPDGSLANGADRQHVAGKYPGILASAPGGGTALVVLDRGTWRFMTGGTWRRMG